MEVEGRTSGVTDGYGKNTSKLQEMCEILKHGYFQLMLALLFLQSTFIILLVLQNGAYS